MDSTDCAQELEIETLEIQQMQETKPLEDVHYKVESCEFFDSFDMLQTAISEFEENTQSNFIVRQKSKDFGNEDVKPNSKSRIHWESRDVQHNKLIHFTGVPYVVVGRKCLQCHLGKDFSLAKKKKYREKRDMMQGEDHTSRKRRHNVQQSKKMGCPAEIYILHIIRYPDFKINVDTEKRRRNASKKIKEAIQRDIEKIEGIHAYVTRFPQQSDHKLHATSGEFANMREKVDRRVQQRIISLHRHGVRKVNEMMRHINAFVAEELFQGGEPPAALRRRFYPTKKDILNLMYKAKSEERKSNLDQENVLNLIKQWQEETPQVQIFCRPNTTAEKITDKHSFLLCYQTEWQQKLLTMYGNQITLLDAAYRTTRYPLPLFFLCVRTNVCYAVVGAFVIQQETTECIQEALHIFQKWNANWNPNCFLVDFCLQEINAISEVFKETEILLCDYHREKAWMEWVTKKVNGVHKSRNIVLRMLRDVAVATTIEEHNIALNTLTNSIIWNTCDALKQWFLDKWIPEIKRWAHVFRPGVLQIAINTSNGLELQNGSLTYTYLDGYKDCTLSEMITVLHSGFFPHTYNKYVQLNLENSDFDRKYDEDIPHFLKNRPQEFINHIITRSSSNLDVTCLNNESGIFKVISESDKDKYYIVNLGADSPACTCEDWRKCLLPCKHMCCIIKFVDGWGWEKINPSYSNNPLFILDPECFPEHNTGERGEKENLSGGIMYTLEPAEQLLDLKPQRTKRTTLIRNCSDKLKRVLDAVCLLKDETFLKNVDNKINDLLQDVQLNIPKDHSLPLIETPKKRKIDEKIEPLPKTQYETPKHPASQTVGVKAEMLRLDVWQSLEMNPEITECEVFYCPTQQVVFI